MKGRLFACLLLSSSMFVIPALAQQGGGRGPSQGQPSDDHRGRQGGQSTEEINSALQDYEQRMSRNLDQCRHELDQMKKELHELIDLRIKMAMSLAESRAKMQPQGPGLAARPGGAFGSSRNEPGSQSRGGDTGHGASSALAGELQRLHNQLRSELDQQQNQVEQLVGQLRSFQQQQTQGHEQQGNAQGQGQQSQGGNQGGQRDRRGQQGQQQRQGQQPGQQNNNAGQGGGQGGRSSNP